VGAPGLVILVPIFNDWAVADLTLAELDRALADEPLPARVILVDDGSTQPMPEGFAQREFQALRCVEVLSLRRNLGHQRAIAIGLAFVHADRPCEVVVVMDGDGEDAPSDVPRLLARLREEGGTRIIFAARTRRSAKGFLSLRLEDLRSRAPTFMPRNIERFSGLVLTRSARLSCSRSTSATGTSCTKSTSPVTSAGIRAALSAIGR